MLFGFRLLLFTYQLPVVCALLLPERGWRQEKATNVNCNVNIRARSPE